MPDIRYRTVLDTSDVLTKLQQLEQRFASVGKATPADVKLNTAPAIQQIEQLEARIKGLGGVNTAGLSGQLAGGQAGASAGANGAQVSQLKELLAAVNAVTVALRDQQQATAASRTALSSIDPAVTNVARAIKQLTTEYRTGQGDAALFTNQMKALQGQARSLADAATLGSRDALVLASALKTAGQSLGEVQRQASPVATSIEQIRREVLGVRSAYQSHNQSAEATIADLKRLKQDGDALRGSLTVGSAEWLKLNQSMRTAAATMDSIHGKTPLLGIEDAMGRAVAKNGPAFAALLSQFGSLGGPLGSVVNQITMVTGGLTSMTAEAALAVAPVAAVSAAVLALAGALAVSIAQAIPFEAGLAQLKGLTGIDSSSITEMGQRFQELSTQLPITSNELIEVARNAVLVGVHGKPEILEFTQIMGQLGVLLRDTNGNMHDLEGTSRELAKFLNAAGIAGDAFIPALRESASELVTLKTHIGGTIPELLNMSSYLVSIGTKMGLTTGQVLALSSAIASTGGKAQSSGHAIARIIEEMQEASIHGGQAADQYSKLLGLTADQFKKLVLNNPAEAFKLLAGRIDEVTKNGTSISQVFSDLGIKNVRLKQTIAEAAVAFPKLSEALGIAADAQKNQGDLAAKAEVATQSYRDQVKELEGAITSVAQAVGLHFLPKMTEIVVKAKDFVKGFQDVANNADTLKGYFYAAATAVGTLTAAMLLNSTAAKAMFAADALGAAGKFFSGGALLTNITKAGAGLKFLGQASSLTFKLSGWQALVRFLALIPVGAAAALAGVALLAGGVAAYSLKILADIKKIQNSNEQSDLKDNAADLARINAYIKKGDDLSKAKARVLLAVRELQQANQGDVVGSDIGGNAIYKVDQAQVDKAQANLAEQKKRLDAVSFAASVGAVADVMLQGRTKSLGDAAHETSEAFGELSDKLSDLSRKFSETKLTTFESNLKQSRDELVRFTAEVDRAYKAGSVSGTERTSLLGKAAGLRTRNIQGLTQRQLDADAKTQTQHEQEIAAARLSIIKDARIKRQGEYDAEVTSLNEKYAPQIKEALQNATTQGITPAQKRSLQNDAGKLQGQQNEALLAAQNKLTSDLGLLDEERTKKIRDGATQRLQAQASEMSQNASSLEAGYKQAEQLAGDDVKARLAVENSLAPQLERVRVQARLTKLKGDQTAIQNEYDDAVRAAKDQGTARVGLENAARETFLSKGRTLQQAYETDVQGYAEARLQAVQEAGAAVTKKQLELDLQGVKQFTGVQLAAYAALYDAKRKAALAEGDPAKAKEFAAALKTLSDTKFSNLADFKKQAEGAVTSLGELRSKLADLNPNKDPVAEARKQAAAQYNPLISSAQKLKTDGSNAFNGLTPDQQAAQLATFKQQQGELSRYILDTSKQREVATLRGQQDANRKIQDDAEQAAAKLAKTRYEANKGDSAPYLLALDQDRKYWQDRIALYASKGAQFKDELAKAQQGLADNDASRAAVLATDRQILQTRRTLAVDEAQSALTLAKTEQERQTARAKLVSLTAQGLVDGTAEIAAARKRGDSEETIAGLIREQLKLKGDLKTFGDDDLARTDQQIAHQRTLLESQLELATSDAQRLTTRAALLSNDQAALQLAQTRLDKAVSEGATLEKIASLEDQRDAAAKNVKADHEADLAVVNGLLDSQIKLLGAQDGYAAAIARSNAEVLSAKQSSLDTSRAELAQIGQRITQAQQDGKTQTEINGLLSEYTQKQTSIYDQQKGIRTYLTGLDRQSLDLLEAQAKSQAEITGASGDTTKAKLLDLDTTRKDLALADKQLANADQDLLTEQEVNEIKKTRLGLLGQEAQQQRDLIQLGLQRQQGELDLFKARATLGLEQSGLGDSAPAAAQAALNAAQKQLTIAHDRLEAATNLDELTKAQTDEVTTQIGALTAQRALVKAHIDDESKTLGLLKAQGETRLALAGLDDNGVAKAQLSLDTANRELTASREQLALAKTADERRDAQTRNAGAVLGQLQAQRAVIQAGLDAQQHQLDLLKAQSAARLILNRQNDDAVATATEGVRQAQAELDLARERVRLAQTPIQRQDAQGAELTAQAALVSAREQLALAPLEGELRHLNLIKAQVAERLELAGLQTDAVATGQAAVAQAQAELELAQQRLDLSQTQAKQEEAQIGVSSARTALSQAERVLVQARVDADQKSFDLLEAQVRGRAQINRLADDAVASALIDLDVTKGKLGLVDRQLNSAVQNRLTQEQINVLLKDQVTLQGQAVQQEDKLLEARRSRQTLLEGLSLAQRTLGSELQGGTPEAVGTRQAIDGVTEARLKLTQAERAYGEAQADLNRSQSTANLEKYRAATETLTGAISNNRAKVKQLADNYATLLTNMDNVRTASENLKGLLTPPDSFYDPQRFADAQSKQLAALATYRKALESGNKDTILSARTELDTQSKVARLEELKPKINFNLEADRLKAIQARRDAAIRETQAALSTGDSKQIAQAAENLKTQEERYRQQVDFLNSKGGQFALTNEKSVNAINNQVDQLGIQYDREAEGIKAKQDIALTESQAASTFNVGADKFTAGTDKFQAGADAFGQQAEALTRTLLSFSPTTPPLNTTPLDAAFSTFDSSAKRLLEGLSKPLTVTAPPPITADRALLNALEKLDQQASREPTLSPGQRADRAAAGRALDNAQVRGFVVSGPYGTFRGGTLAAKPDDAALIKEVDRQRQLALEQQRRADQLAANIAFALRPNANTVQRAVDESLSRIKNITPLLNPGTGPNGGRTVNNNQRLDLTINVPAGSNTEDIAQVVRREFANMNREAEVFGECP